MQAKDWTGTRFGKLTVKKFTERQRRNKRYVYLWECECDCGTIKNIDIYDLRKGSTNSCGCSTSEFISKARRKPDGEAAVNSLFASYKRTCSFHRGLPFELTKEEFCDLLKGNCFYCNTPPSQVKKSKLSFAIYNGIDRVDNSKGYSKENCVPCCKQCNTLKGGITLKMVKKIVNFFIDRGSKNEDS